MRISDWSSDVCSSELSISTRLRRPGVVGLKFLSAIALDPRGHVDAVTFVESHESLLHVGALADLAAEALRLALVAQRVDGLHLHLERSEEHTSELQSLMRISYAFFCLQKNTQNQNNN